MQPTSYHTGAQFADVCAQIGDNSFFVVDKIFQAAYAPVLRGRRVLFIRGDETYKTLRGVQAICKWLLNNHCHRDSCVVAVGGGALLDVVGYAGSVYMRGVKTILIPTTFLAQIDACMGGKTAVNLGQYKNAIGTFHLPTQIFWCDEFLAQLPVEYFSFGMAECIKHAIVADASFFHLLQHSCIDELRTNQHLRDEIIQRNIAIKTRIIERDIYEHNERKHLNFGHTLAHALERVLALPHGQAVSLGMIAAMGWSAPSYHHPAEAQQQLDQVKQLCTRYGLPIQCSFSVPQILPLFHRDKKHSRDQLTLVLVERIGQAKLQSVPVDSLEPLLYDAQKTLQ